MKKGLVVILVLMTGWLQYRLWAGPNSIQDVVRFKQLIATQTVEIEKLTARNRQLAVEVRDLKAHPDALEERARSELGMIKKDETFYLVLEPAR